MRSIHGTVLCVCYDNNTFCDDSLSTHSLSSPDSHLAYDSTDEPSSSFNLAFRKAIQQKPRGMANIYQRVLDSKSPPSLDVSIVTVMYLC